MNKREALNFRGVVTVGAGVLAGTLAAAATVRAVVRSRRWYDFRGKSVLIMGGSRGLGLVIARRFADAGARVAICARDGDELARARHDLAAHAANDVMAVQCDVTDPEQVDGTVDTVAAHFGRLDVLVNNAAVIQVGPAQEMTPDDYEVAMRTIFWSALHATRAALPHLRRQGGGRIANVASIGGKIAVPHLLPYSAAKFALVGLGEGLRAELLAENIYVTTVCPGLIRTGSPPNADFKGWVEEEYAWFATGDVTPVLSASAERVAAKLLDAVRHGDAEVTVPLSATLPILLHGLAPGVTAELMAVANRFLPRPGGIGSAAKGRDVAGKGPAWANGRNRAVGLRTNQFGD
jgi:NAD(P)-dependent dehydrogenase (short-subunit alcohol dehydrogenase family)